MDSLDKKFEVSEFSNTFEAAEEDRKVRYECLVKYFEFKGRDILCYVNIGKYAVIETAKHKLFHRNEIKKIKTESKQLWYFYVNSAHLVKDGKPATDYLNQDHYRSAIRGKGLAEGIDMSPELLDRAFNSIDEQAMDLYERVFGSKSSLNQHPGDNSA